MGLRLLPGERVRTVLRPHPLGFASRYLAALLPALWGLVLWWLARTAWWAGGSDGRWYEVWTWLYGNAAALSVYALAGMLLLGGVVGASCGQWRYAAWFAAGGVVAVLAGVAVQDHAWSVPATLWSWSLPGVAAVEAFRRSHRYHLTNLRIVFRRGIAVRRERQVRYDAITDLDTTPGPGAFFDVGTIIPVTADARAADEGGRSRAGTEGPPEHARSPGGHTLHRLTGIRPLSATRELLRDLIQEAAGTTGLQRRAASSERPRAASAATAVEAAAPEDES